MASITAQANELTFLFPGSFEYTPLLTQCSLRDNRLTAVRFPFASRAIGCTARRGARRLQNASAWTAHCPWLCASAANDLTTHPSPSVSCWRPGVSAALCQRHRVCRTPRCTGVAREPHCSVRRWGARLHEQTCSDREAKPIGLSPAQDRQPKRNLRVQG